MGWIDDTDTLFPHRSDRGNITAERLLFMVEETEAEIIRSGTEKAKASDDTNPGGSGSSEARSGTEKAKASDDTNPGGSGSSEALFNRNPGGLKLSKLPDDRNPRGLKLSGVFF